MPVRWCQCERESVNGKDSECDEKQHAKGSGGSACWSGEREYELECEVKNQR